PIPGWRAAGSDERVPRTRVLVGGRARPLTRVNLGEEPERCRQLAAPSQRPLRWEAMSEEEKTSIQAIGDLLRPGRSQNAYLIVISAKSAAGVGRMFKLDKPETILGRSVEASLQVEDDGISRKHAKIIVDGQGLFTLVDLGSTNGTYLNGTKVPTAQLNDGD